MLPTRRGSGEGGGGERVLIERDEEGDAQVRDGDLFADSVAINAACGSFCEAAWRLPS